MKSKAKPIASFESLRAGAEDSLFPLNILLYFFQAAKVTNPTI